MDANENLYAIVFGESIFNDAIGIVMFETVMSMGMDEDKTPTHEDKTPTHEVFSAAGKFVIIFCFSLLIGAMTALIVAFIIKRQATYESGSKMDKPVDGEEKSLRQQTWEDE